MKRHILIILSFVAAVAVHALPITRGQAEKNVRAFLAGPSPMNYAFGQLKITEADNGSQPYYIFNIGSDNGFVIASGDDATYKILGYSHKGSFDKDNVPENMQNWLDGYAEQIRRAQKLNLPTLRSGMKTSGSARPYIPALIKTKWNQGYPYNKQCPDFGDGLGNRVTGCVATAYSQVMYYHRWPQNPTPEIPAYSYEELKEFGGDGKVKEVSALPSTTFKWDLMKNEYDNKSSEESCDAVAELMSYCGRAVQMMYCVNASGAFSENIAPALINYFGYNRSARIIYRNNYTTQEEWENIIYDELMKSRPVIYSGSTKTSAHQFICDGYDDGFFHINWGWGGSSDGFFILSVLDPGVQGIGGSTPGSSYSLDQSAVIGVRRSGIKERLYVDEIIINRGENATASIYLDSYEENYTSVQFDMQLPEGIDVLTDSLGNPVIGFEQERSERGDHITDINRLSEGNYRIVIYSPTNSSITKEGGRIAFVRLNTSAAGIGMRRININNIKICDKDLHTRMLSDVSPIVDVREPDYVYLGWYSFFNNNYDDYNTISYGSDNNHYDCAIRINANGTPAIIGKQLRAVKMAFVDVADIDSVKVWLSYSLPSVPEKADICCQNVAKSDLMDFYENDSPNMIFLDKNYVMGKKDVYIGYSFDITKKTNTNIRPVITIGNWTYNGALYISDRENWYDMSDTQGFGNLGLSLFFDDCVPYVQGDVNYDDVANVADASTIINSIMGRYSILFNKRAADVNKNGEINIADVASVVDIILERNSSSEETDSEETNDAVMLCSSENGVDVMLSGSNHYQAMQMDVILPEGEDITDIISDDLIKSTHSLDYNRISDNKYRIAVYSVMGNDFLKTTMRLFSMRTSVKDLKLENIIFVTSGLHEKRFTNVNKTDVTGIYEINRDRVNNVIYTIDGKKIDRPADCLEEGVYIINGNKVIIK